MPARCVIGFVACVHDSYRHPNKPTAVISCRCLLANHSATCSPHRDNGTSAALGVEKWQPWLGSERVVCTFGTRRCIRVPWKLVQMTVQPQRLRQIVGQNGLQ